MAKAKGEERSESFGLILAFFLFFASPAAEVYAFGL